MSSDIIQSIVDLYNERSRQRNIITPYGIFIRNEGTDIYNELKKNMGTRPKVADVRLAYRNAWNSVSTDKKILYEEAAIKLGYVKPSLDLEPRRNLMRRRIRSIIDQGN